MSAERIVHFVCFETRLNASNFTEHLQNFDRSTGSDRDVKIYQSEKNGSYKYVMQHQCGADGFRFIFEKGKKALKNRGVEMRVEMSGGYRVMEMHKKPVGTKGSRVFLFLPEITNNLEIYRDAGLEQGFHIYSPYFENCRYSYIMEYFTHEESAFELARHLRNICGTAAIYKSCKEQLA